MDFIYDDDLLIDEVDDIAFKAHQAEKTKHRVARKKDVKYKHRLKTLANIGIDRTGVYYKDITEFWDKTRKPRYVKQYHPTYYKVWKHQCNIKIRRNKNVILQRGLKNHFTELKFLVDD